MGVSIRNRAHTAHGEEPVDAHHGEHGTDSVDHDLVGAPQPPPPAAGSAPFSEPETRALRAIVEKYRPTSYVSVRTGAIAVTIPWDCKAAQLPETQRSRLLRVSEGITASHCAKCDTGNLWNVTGKTKCGTAADYLYGTANVPFVHTWHVYNAPQAPKGDCFRRYNPTTKEGYERVVNNWAQAVFNFTTAVHNWMTLETSVGLDSAQQNASLSAAAAASRRADNLARGVPDPEIVEFEQSGNSDKEQAGSSDSLNHEKYVPGEPERKAGLFSWISAGRNPSQDNIVIQSKNQHNVGPQSLNANENEKLGMLTGWMGAWAAMIMLGAGMFIVRRYVFQTRPRRSRFRSRTPVKNA